MAQARKEPAASATEGLAVGIQPGAEARYARWVLMSDDEHLALANARLGNVLRGKYRLERVLGIGGMATVYAAKHRNRKQFAIKMLHPELSVREQFRTRFIREGYVANSVMHHGAVAVLDDDVAEDGSAFLVMELLSGQPVDAVWVDYNQEMPLAIAMSIGDALLDVLAAAHEHGIVHRDLKPANLFLTNDGELKVLDFGIARLKDDSGGGGTATGAMLGTPAFMAPEQALGKTDEIDAQTDIWAVGATLFTLLGGALVHEGDNAQQLLVNAATKRARALQSVAEGVPAPIAAVIDRALAFDKSERWKSAAEMREALGKANVAVLGTPIGPLPKRETKPSSGAFDPTIEAHSTPANSGPTVLGKASDGAVPVAAKADAAPAAASADADAKAKAKAKAEASSKGARVTPPVSGMLSTAAPVVARTVSDPPPSQAPASESEGAGPRKRRIGTMGAIGIGAIACAAAAGAVAYRGAQQPRVRYCAFVDDLVTGLGCAAEVTPAVAAARFSPTHRFTEVGGRTSRVEDVSFAGQRARPFWEDDGAQSTEIVRGDDGTVREVIVRDPHGNIDRWEKWSDGGKRVDLVDDDGSTPRGLRKTSITRVDREIDGAGRVVAERYFAAGGRPARDERGAYGYTLAFGRAPATPIKTTILGPDGKPGVGLRGESVVITDDDGVPGGTEDRYLDIEGKPVAVDGVYRRHRSWSPAYEMIDNVELGAKGERVVNLATGICEERRQWDKAKHAVTTSWFDATGRQRPMKGEPVAGFRVSFDDRGRRVMLEHLDAHDNRVYERREGSAANRFGWNDQGDVVTIELLDVTGALQQGRLGFARQVNTHDAHGRVIEERLYDESGKLASWREGGPIRKMARDERGLVVSSAYFDAAEHPAATSTGEATTRFRYGRMRENLEVASLGPDGQPCMGAEGYAIKRQTFDPNGDLVAAEYLDPSGAPTMVKGEYATERITRDALGLEASHEYIDGHGERVIRKDGYAIARFTRDRNGDIVEFAYLGKREEPVVREGGYSKRRTKYDVHRRPIEVVLVGVSGAPSPGSEGWTIERNVYDDRGLIVRQDHLDAEQKPVALKNGSASLTKTYDARGNLLEATTLGVDGKPIATPDGYATKKSVYDERDQVVEESLFDADGKPAAGKAGWSMRRLRYDDLGNMVEEAFFDGDHHPTPPKGAAYASVVSRLDARQRLVETAYLDAGGAPAKGPEGVASIRYKRDAYGHAVETSYVDGSGVPTASVDGKMIVRTTYDDAGRVSEELFVDAAGAPLLAKDGCAGHRAKYDRLGRKLEESCLDGKGGLALGVNGWATHRTLWDARGNPVDESTYGPDGALHADKDGVARRKNTYDERNLLRETALFDAADKPVHNLRGAHAMRFAYDDSGKRVGETAVDEKGAELPKKR
jgi:YD repeat-containing protein